MSPCDEGSPDAQGLTGHHTESVRQPHTNAPPYGWHMAVNPRIILLSLLLVGGLETTAYAQAPSQADRLFREGREALKRGDLTEACAKLADSLSLDPAPGTLLSLAECEDRQGQPVAAWKHVKQALRDLNPGDERVPIARERLAALERRLPKITHRLPPNAPPKLQIERDGVVLDPAETGSPQAVTPGEHEFVVRDAEGRERRTTVKAREGGVVEVTLGLPDGTQRPTAPTAAAEPPQQPRSWLGPVALGIGGASTVVSLLLYSNLRGKEETATRPCAATDTTCRQEADDAASSGRTLAPIFYGTTTLAVAGLGLGAYLTFSGDPRSSKTVSLLPTRDGAHLRFVGRF